ncbi:MAG: hypothetical protein KIT56_10110 [Gammaproteobacteria bacterium]|nr:hypothetical protein [Gammaproteobacteria bacterium]MCW5584203.1 hypothetical protein [Gammaproteobacteria bacterium]
MDNQFIQMYQLGYLFSPSPALRTYFDIFMFNFFFCILFAVILLYFVPKRFKKSHLYLSLLFIAFGTFIPIFGLILLLVGVYLLHYYARHYRQAEVVTAMQKQFGSEKFAKLSAYAAGWAHTRIFNQSFRKEERERALYAINKQRTKQVNDVNRALLSDSTDEIRLYAFNVLNKQQSLMTSAIKNCLDMKEKTSDVGDIAKINKSLAYLYWEYFSLNLNQGQLAEEMLSKAHIYATEAVQVLVEDGNLWLLLAKISNKLNKEDEYQKALEVARGLMRIPPEIYLDLAALSYANRDFKQMQAYLNEDMDLCDVSTNASLIKFWCKHE